MQAEQPVQAFKFIYRLEFATVTQRGLAREQTVNRGPPRCQPEGIARNRAGRSRISRPASIDSVRLVVATGLARPVVSSVRPAGSARSHSPARRVAAPLCSIFVDADVPSGRRPTGCGP